MTSVAYPAGLLRRLAAATYDLLLLIALLFAASVLVLVLRGGVAVPPETPWFTAYLVTIAYVFFGWFWTHGGQTLGMRAWRMQLRDGGGGQIGWLQALRRYLCAYVSWLSLFGMLWCLFDAQRRAWHDIVSGTEIVVLPTQPRGAH